MATIEEVINFKIQNAKKSIEENKKSALDDIENYGNIKIAIQSLNRVLELQTEIKTLEATLREIASINE